MRLLVPISLRRARLLPEKVKDARLKDSGVW